MSIVLGFDFGMKHIGIAVGQSLTGTATPLGTIFAQDGIPNWEQIQHYIIEWRPKQLIVGIPLRMDGSEQPVTYAARGFVERLEAHFKLPVVQVDERLSSWEAKQQLRARGLLAKNKDRGKVKIKSHKKQIADLNAMAAAILIEQWFNDSQSVVD